MHTTNFWILHFSGSDLDISTVEEEHILIIGFATDTETSYFFAKQNQIDLKKIPLYVEIIVYM